MIGTHDGDQADSTFDYVVNNLQGGPPDATIKHENKPASPKAYDPEPTYPSRTGPGQHEYAANIIRGNLSQMDVQIEADPVMNRMAQHDETTNQYDTKLSPEEEKQFQGWKSKNAPNDSGADYDLRGAYIRGFTPDPQSGHWPDTFKKPNHPTFSDQSIYAKDRPDLAGRWEGDKYIPASGASGMPAGAIKGSTPILPTGEFKINTKHDVKSGAVAGKDNNTVYIDPSIPHEFHPFLAVHEETEKRLMAGGMNYDQSHIIATLAEKHAVEGSGMTWDKYTNAVDPYVAKAEKGSGKNPPPDPHVNIEDAIGHHADKAAVLEHADNKIASDADERPTAGKQYAMVNRTIFPQEEGIDAEINAHATGFGGRINSGQGPGTAGTAPGYRPAVMPDKSIESTGVKAYKQAIGKEVTLKRTSKDEDYDGNPLHSFEFNNGERKGDLTISETEGGKNLHVEWAGLQMKKGKEWDIQQEGPQSFGYSDIKALMPKLKEEFPNAEIMTGYRVSGVREKSGQGPEKAVIALKPEGQARAKEIRDEILKLREKSRYVKFREELPGTRMEDLWEAAGRP